MPEQQQSDTGCDLCKTDKHSTARCPLDCKVCQNWGHRSSQCPRIVCKNCNVPGHTRKKCPKEAEKYQNGDSNTTSTPTTKKKTQAIPSTIKQEELSLCTCSNPTCKVVCTVCPTYTVVSWENTHEIEVSSDLVTIVCKVQDLPADATKVKIFSPQNCKSQLPADYFVSDISDRKLFLTLDTTHLQGEPLPSKGKSVALCQATNIEIKPTKIEAEVSLSEPVKIFPGMTADLRLELLGYKSPKYVKPLVMLAHFSTRVPERKSLLVLNKRINLQDSKEILVPVKNISSDTVVLNRTIHFGYLKLFTNSEIDQSRRNVTGPDSTSGSSSIAINPCSTNVLDSKRTKTSKLRIYLSLDLFHVGSGETKILETKDVTLHINGVCLSYFITPTSYFRGVNSKSLVEHNYLLKDGCFFFDEGHAKEAKRTFGIKDVLGDILSVVKENQNNEEVLSSNTVFIFRTSDECESFFRILYRFELIESLTTLVKSYSVLDSSQLNVLFPNSSVVPGVNMIARMMVEKKDVCRSVWFRRIEKFIPSITDEPIERIIGVQSCNRKESPKRTLQDELRSSKKAKSISHEEESESEQKCTCFHHKYLHAGQEKCNFHKHYTLRSTLSATMHPLSCKTILCTVEDLDDRDASDPSSLKVFPPSDENSSTLAIVQKSRNIYDGKIFITIRNLSERYVKINCGQAYAVGNEILPKGHVLREASVQEHVAVVHSMQESSIDPSNHQFIPCKIIPPLKCNTLVAIQSIDESCMVNGICTIQDNNVCFVNVRSPTNSTIKLNNGDLVGEVISLMDFPGMCFLEKPYFATRMKTEVEMEKLELLKNYRKGRDCCKACSHYTLKSEVVCKQCPVYHLITVSNTKISKNSKSLVICILSLIDNYPNMVYSVSRESFVKLFPSKNLNNMMLDCGSKNVYLNNRIGRIYKTRFVCVQIGNDLDKDIDVPANFVLAAAQTFQFNKDIPYSRSIRLKQVEVLHIQPQASRSVQFVPLVNAENFFLDISVTKTFPKRSHGSVCNWSMDKAPIMVQKDGSFWINITNKRYETMLCKALQVDLHFDACRLPQMMIPSFSGIFTSHISNVNTNNNLDLFENLVELVNINSFSVKPGQVLSILAHAKTLPLFAASLSIIDTASSGNLRIMPSKQPVFKQFVFVAVSNPSLETVHVKDKGLTVGYGFPLPYSAPGQFTSISAVNKSKCRLGAGEKLSLVCEVSFNKIHPSEEIQLNSVVSFKPSHFSQLKIKSGLETVYYDFINNKSLVKLQLENISKSELDLLQDEEICKGESMMSESFVEQVVKLSDYDFHLDLEK